MSSSIRRNYTRDGDFFLRARNSVILRWTSNAFYKQATCAHDASAKIASLVPPPFPRRHVFHDEDLIMVRVSRVFSAPLLALAIGQPPGNNLARAFDRHRHRDSPPVS